MGTTLTGLTPATTYDALIKVGDNGPITGALKVLSDGLGTNLPMEASTTAINFTGTLTQAGTTLQSTLVSGTNIKTINGTSVLGSGNIAVVTSPSGVAGAIQFSNGSAFASDATNLFWDDTNNRLGIGTNAPDTTATFKGGVSGAVGTRIATLEGSLPELLFKDTSSSSGFAITKYGSVIYFTNTNASGGYTSYCGLTNTSRQWSLGHGGNPLAQVDIKGSGSTSATTSLLVQNSAGTAALKVTDDGIVSLNRISSLDGTGIVTMPVYLQSQSGNFVFKNSGSSDLLLLNSSVASFLGTIAFNNSSPSASACVDLTSTTKGFLPPRMTTTQKNAIATPAAGLVVYDSTTNKLCCYNGSTWNDLF